MQEKRLQKILELYRKENTGTLKLIDHSYLSTAVKEIYQKKYSERLATLNNLFNKKYKNNSCRKDGGAVTFL